MRGYGTASAAVRRAIVHFDFVAGGTKDLARGAAGSLINYYSYLSNYDSNDSSQTLSSSYVWGVCVVCVYRRSKLLF